MSNIFKVLLAILVLVAIGTGVWLLLPDKQEAQPATNQQPSTEGPDLKDQIGQMLMIGFRGTEFNPEGDMVKILNDVKVGGVVLFDKDVPTNSFPRNITSPDQTKKLISDLQTHTPTPLLVAVDAEGGSVNRLNPKYGFSSIMSAKDMGKSTQTTSQESAKLATELKGLGFNMNLAPVVDLNVNPSNPVIGALNRSFSADPNIVIEDAAAFIKAQNQEGIITAEKHFPGHGSSTQDSHLGLVDVTKTYQQKELEPYTELQKRGLLDVVMTAHIINQNIDKEYPATLSPKFLQDILRKQIGFQGVIISDDMQMGAIAKNYGLKDALIRAINAGCDILLLTNNGTLPYDKDLPYKARDIIYQAVQDGQISTKTIEDSYNRIMNLKKKYHVLPDN